MSIFQHRVAAGRTRRGEQHVPGIVSNLPTLLFLCEAVGMRGRGRIKCSASICERTVLVKYSQGDFAHWSFSFGCSLIFFMAIKVVDFLVKTPLTKLGAKC